MMITTRLLTSVRTRGNACQRFMSSTKSLAFESKLSPQSLIYQTIQKKSVDRKFSFRLSHLQTIRYNSTSSPKSAKERIEDLLNKSEKKVFVFMKGIPEQPACGYSNAVVQILNAYEVDYDSFDVLKDDEIRQEVKVYSNWPTIPQVYVDKTFIGGCDILIQMHQSDELEQLFNKTKPPT